MVENLRSIYVIFEFLVRKARKKDYVGAEDGDDNRALPNGEAYFRGRNGRYGSFARGERFPDSFRWVCTMPTYRCWENVCRATTMPSSVDRSITLSFSLFPFALLLQSEDRVELHRLMRAFSRDCSRFLCASRVRTQSHDVGARDRWALISKQYRTRRSLLEDSRLRAD